MEALSGHPGGLTTENRRKCENKTTMPHPGPDTLGLYISIPFCRSKCTYCNFASGVYPASEHARYVDRLIADLAAASAWAAAMGVTLPTAVDSIYLGGGTPSVLSGPDMARLFAAIRARLSLTQDCEITVECAPGQISDETLAAMATSGVNRVSLGVQSFIDTEAASSGRLHTRAQVLADLTRLRAAGISNINLDLLAGLAGQSLATWQESLKVLTDAGTPHASVYMLEIDEDSRLRRNSGISLSAMTAEFGAAAMEPALAVIHRLIQDELLIQQSGRVFLSPRGRLLSNDVFQEFLGLGIPAHAAHATA